MVPVVPGTKGNAAELAYLVWESSWDQWRRVLVVGVMAAAHLILSAPRLKRRKVE